MFCAMLGVVKSRWQVRIDTSLVESLMLGVEKFGDREKTNVVTDEWLKFLEKKKFPNLNFLCINCCIIITDAGLTEVARGCSSLQTLNLDCCCSNITDASLMVVARRCSNLQTLNLYNCSNITDASLLEVATQGCSNLQSLYLGGCRNITAACRNALQQSNSKTTNLKFSYIWSTRSSTKKFDFPIRNLK